jgi:hypothetical protein
MVFFIGTGHQQAGSETVLRETLKNVAVVLGMCEKAGTERAPIPGTALRSVPAWGLLGLGLNRAGLGLGLKLGRGGRLDLRLRGDARFGGLALDLDLRHRGLRRGLLLRIGVLDFLFAGGQAQQDRGGQQGG